MSLPIQMWIWVAMSVIYFFMSTVVLHISLCQKLDVKLQDTFTCPAIQNSYNTHLNVSILVEWKILKHDVSSVAWAEAEIEGVFHNAQISVPMQCMIECLNHPQTPAPIKTDNSNSNDFIYDNMNQKWSKSWIMRYYWLCEWKTKTICFFG